MLKNIIIVNDFAYINGGAAKVAIESALGLAKQGYNVIFFAAVGPIDRRLENRGIKVICLGQKDILADTNRLRAFFQGLWNNKSKSRLNKLLSEYSPSCTVVHVHGWIKALSSSIWYSISNKRFRTVVTLHDYFLFCPNGGLFNYQSKKICHLRPYTISCYTCNCDSRTYIQKIWRVIRQLIINHFFSKNNNISVIYISELNRAVSYPHLKKQTGKWYYINNPVALNKITIVDVSKNDTYLFVGRLSPEKGAALFCKAIKDLNLRGEVLGDGI